MSDRKVMINKLVLLYTLSFDGTHIIIEFKLILFVRFSPYILQHLFSGINLYR